MKISNVRLLCAIHALPVVIAACFAAPANGDLIHIASDSSNSTESLGSFEGTIEYNFGGGSSGTLVISLNNTSVADNGGFITGLLFNFDTIDASAAATLQSASHPFTDTGGGNGAPFGGDYDAGAALGGDFLGGGSPHAGIAMGTSGTMSFSIVASDAATLTAASFLQGPYAFDFIVRFKGFGNGGSDKVPAIVVPTSGSMALLAVAGCVPFGRRRRSD